jgi:hypothetical protein
MYDKRVDKAIPSPLVLYKLNLKYPYNYIDYSPRLGLILANSKK